MKKGSRILPIDQVVPGMCLAQELFDANGALLLPAGTEIQACHLTSLRRRNITQLSILVEEPEVSPEEAAAREAMIRARLAHLFRNAPQDTVNQTLFRAVLEYRLEQTR